MAAESGPRTKLDREGAAPEAGHDEHRVFNVAVGESIRRSRQERGWTQAFLAGEARLSPNYVARLERGELGPSLFVASRLCEALGVSLESLVGPPASGATRRTTTRRRAAS